LFQNPSLTYTIFDVKDTVKKYLYLEDDTIIDILMGAFLANQLKADPFWLIIIAPPSSAKTELLRGFDGNSKVEFLSSLTPKTLVSGFKKEDGTEPSLLATLDKKILILKDFTTILTLRSEHRQEILSQLREIYDGFYNSAYGTGKNFEWKGRVGLMAACTPEFDNHQAAINILGDRYILFRMNIQNSEAVSNFAQKVIGKEQEMRDEIKCTFSKFLTQFDNFIFSTESFSPNDKLTNLACFCAGGRCGVSRNYRNQAIISIPEPEGPARLIKQLTQLGVGIAFSRGKSNIDSEIYKIIAKVGLDLMPTIRKKILFCLWQEHAFEKNQFGLSINEISSRCNLPYSTIKYYLEELQAIRIIKKIDGEKKWQLSQQYYDWATHSGIFS